MADFSGLIELIRKTVVETVGRMKPSGVYYGKVTSVSPIRISVDQRLVLTEEFIVLGRNLTEFSDSSMPGDSWNGLRKGDELVLIREQGGQRYCVVDWVRQADEDTRPAWPAQGEVVSVNPVKIKVNEHLTLATEVLIFCRNVTDYYLDMSASHETEPETGHVHLLSDGASYPTSHLHEYKGRKKFLVHNGLMVGDKVLLVRERSSRKWFVVDYVSRSQGAVWGQWV